MVFKNEVIVGFGEIGSSLSKVIGNCIVQDPGKGEFAAVTQAVDVMHICFPYTDSFVDEVKAYQKRYKPELTIIYSTVPIGTTQEIGGMTVHSPVEGKHPDLSEGFRAFRWIGADIAEAGQKAIEYWEQYSKHSRVLPNSKFTEFLKLRSTSKYAINIAWTDYEHKVSEDLAMPFEYIQDFDIAYNKLYADNPRVQRYILDPPEGEIGGHCLMPNAKLLNEQYYHPWLENILKMEKKQ